ELAESGVIRGSVLDVGCGTGENALYLAGRGHETWGLDFVPAAIERARAKAEKRGIDVMFVIGDALKLADLGRQFDTVIDCGLFHTFSDEQRPGYVRGLGYVLHPGGLLHILCFSEEEPSTEGPRRVTQQEIRQAFTGGWRVRQIAATRFIASDVPGGPHFSPGGPKAWLASIERT
ncbi:MAG TPA: class I SAM-dependent methyltransferase, partial [Pirellulales bacterium]|nr:class I SAM-dependent methyltransferase [Pirellulales bacterium]